MIAAPGYRERVAAILASLAVEPAGRADRATHGVTSPVTGEPIARVAYDDTRDLDVAVGRAHDAFRDWRSVPAPRRGELIRLFGNELRAAKDDLALLVSLEAGKIASEARGEVQEMIDICDFAVGLSRQLYGLTIASERPGHTMRETWLPLGVCGIISAFNFPVAVWAWNAAIALVCGNTLVWKPSEKTPLTALAAHALLERALAQFSEAPPHVSAVVIGDRALGEALVDDPRVRLVSATGSTAMGAAVGPRLAARFARAILELGGNNAAIVTPAADLDLAVRAIVFSAVGTAGQRCTTLRRLIVHESIAETVVARLKTAYAGVPIGDPTESGTLVGPLIDRAAYEAMQASLAAAVRAGGRVFGGERVRARQHPDAYYVTPALVEVPAQSEVVARETFAPILYVMRYTDLREAIELQNGVSQGLASSIFTNDLREAELFTSPAGSDCGIINVNIGPSGAEIGGAFGGEKATGGGREAGSDAWKAYMRRATTTVNGSRELPLAQGVRFETPAGC
jgi:aldehyde dehydrogenase (NAD+)